MLGWDPGFPGNYIHIQSVRTSTVSEAIGHPSLGHPNKLKFSVLVHMAHPTPWYAREGTTHDVNSGLIIESNLQTSATSTGIRIGPVSVASLNVTQYKHHVINNTWKFPGNHITANANAGGP